MLSNSYQTVAYLLKKSGVAFSVPAVSNPRVKSQEAPLWSGISGRKGLVQGDSFHAGHSAGPAENVQQRRQDPSLEKEVFEARAPTLISEIAAEPLIRDILPEFSRNRGYYTSLLDYTPESRISSHMGFGLRI